MKKFIAMFTAVLSFLLLSVPVTAAQGQNGNIGTTVPTEHSVSIEAEHAFALYTEGSKGQSAAYLVPRFSEPQFTLQAEDGYRITRVLVNDRDVTAQVTDGVLKLSSVKADVTITIVTEADTSRRVQIAPTILRSQTAQRITLQVPQRTAPWKIPQIPAT